VANSTPPPDFVRLFLESMPASYRRAFDIAAVTVHARLASERGMEAANVGSFTSHRAPGTAICVIAKDRPGLLATISAALVMCGLDVISGEAYTRRLPDGQAEAVDVFWLRHADAVERKLRVQKDEISALKNTLIGLIEGRIDPREALDRPPVSMPSSSAAGTVVRFLEGHDGELATLEVETSDRSGLLHALSRALFEQGVQIVQSEVKTIENRVFDRFSVVELDGSSISPARRLQLQVAVMSAIDPSPVMITRGGRNDVNRAY
jgi:[protein-PII] uridylyltransferase